MTLEEKFVSQAGCMDGRDRCAVGTLAGRHYVDDVCSGPGTVGILSDVSHPEHGLYLDKFRKQVTVSYEKHGSRILYVSGHQGCAGHPVSDERHRADVITASGLLHSVLEELGYHDMEVIPVWSACDEESSEWRATKLTK